MVVCNPGEEEKALLDRGYREVKIKNVKDNLFKPKESLLDFIYQFSGGRRNGKRQGVRT